MKKTFAVQNRRMNVKFSIIIPVKSINAYVRETVPYIQAIERQDWELIILPNELEPDEWNDERIAIVPSGKVGPAKKRDMGAELAKGEILVFLDDDSYPEQEFLNIAFKHFENNRVVAIGGPAMTPPTDSFWQRVSGAVFLSKLSGGAPERYVPVGEVREIHDWPSVNLMVRRNNFRSIGGFNSTYWPGEDTKLCLDLIKESTNKILYVPEMIVWHHRRAGLMGHLKQIGGYAIHRGYFAKKYPETSRKLLYFIPSMFVLFVCATLVCLVWIPSLNKIMLLGWIVYAAGLSKAYFDMRRYESRAVSIVGIGYTFLTHCWYGVRFLQGLLTLRLVSKLR